MVLDCNLLQYTACLFIKYDALIKYYAMSQKKFGYITMVLMTSLLVATVSMPLKYVAAQNATTPQSEEMMTEDMIKAKIAQFKSEHPQLGTLLDKLQSMDMAQTLKAIIAIHPLESLLDAHARNLLLQGLAEAR